MKKIKARDVFDQFFIPKIHNKFRKDVPSVNKFEELLTEKGAILHLDHGATRTPSKGVHDLITRIGKAFGMKPMNQYAFPEKKLTAIDLQFEDSKGFKWFSTLIDYKKFSPKTAELIEEDMERSPNLWNEKGLLLLSKLEKDAHLSEEDADGLTDQIMNHFLCRQGPLLKKETYDAVAKESSECVNALLMGPDYNHIAYSLHELNVPEWFGVDIIDIIDAFLRHHGFEMLPEIQGAPSSILRQTSTKADTVSFDLDEGNGKLLKIKSPSKFIELIQRGPIRDDKGKIVIKRGSIERFQSFISKNTVKLYEATGLKH